MYLLENAKELKELYKTRVMRKYAQTGDKKSAEFSRKVDDLLYYLAALAHSNEAIIAYGKNEISTMYTGILKAMNQELRENEKGIYKDTITEMSEEQETLAYSTMMDIREKLSGYENYVPFEENAAMMGEDADHNQNVPNKLGVLADALKTSNKKIYGRPSPLYREMQDKLAEVQKAAVQLKKYDSFKIDEFHSERVKQDYKHALEQLKTAAEKYYLYKMHKTKGGEKANSRERSRLDLAKLVIDAANGRNLAEVCESIPAELKAAAPVRNAPADRYSAAVLA